MTRRPLLGLVLGLAAAGAWAELSFQEATLGAGLLAPREPLQFPFANMTGGATVGDFNRDGWQDLFLLGGGGAPDALYLNNGDGTFSAITPRRRVWRRTTAASPRRWAITTRTAGRTCS